MIQDNNVESVYCADNENWKSDIDERRLSRRINVENFEIVCDMPSATRVKVMNISEGGTLVMADKLINIGKSYALKIEYKGKLLFVKAEAVWALLADCMKQDNGDVIPLFIAGMRFVHVIRGEIPELLKLLATDTEKSLHDAFMGSLQGST